MNTGRSLPARFLRNFPAMLGATLLLLICVVAVFAPEIAPGDPLDMQTVPYLSPGQNLRFPLGSDAMGADVFSQLVHGARVSMLVGLFSTLLGLAVGVVIGGAAGYYGGVTGSLLVRFTEMFQTFPPFLLVIILVAIASPSVASITLSIGVVSWPTVARLVRAEFLTLRSRDFVLAAEAAGFSDLRIMLTEILPNAAPPLIVTSSVMMATAILVESGLSFLGLADPNRVSWGSMIGAGREDIDTAAYLVTLPGLAIVVAVLALNMLSDGLNEVLDPRAIGSR